MTASADVVLACSASSCPHAACEWLLDFSTVDSPTAHAGSTTAGAGTPGAGTPGAGATVDGTLTLQCAECHVKCCVLDRQRAELVSGKINMWVDELAVGTGMQLCFAQPVMQHGQPTNRLRLDPAQAHVDFQWRDQDGREFTMRVGYVPTSAPWQPPAEGACACAAEQTDPPHIVSKFRGRLAHALRDVPELHHDVVRAISWEAVDGECGRLRELCADMWDEDAATAREEEWRAHQLVDLDPIRVCRFLVPPPGRAASCAAVAAAMHAELQRLDEYCVVLPEAQEQFAALADEYRRLQRRVSWEHIQKEDTNRGDLVNVRACYVALRAIEDHIAGAFSATTLYQDRYHQRSHGYQLEQIYANNACNSLKLSDEVYTDLRRVLALVAQPARKIALVCDPEPLVHRWQVAMCMRGLIGDTRAKNVAFRIPRVPVADMLPGRGQAVQDLYDMTHVDAQHRIISDDLHRRFVAALWEYARGRGEHELRAVAQYLAPGTRSMVDAVLGAPPSHAFLQSSGCCGYQQERVAGFAVSALARRVQRAALRERQ